jgi:hypothetical protein
MTVARIMERRNRDETMSRMTKEERIKSLQATVRILRGSGVQLSPEHEEQVKKWEKFIDDETRKAQQKSRPS